MSVLRMIRAGANPMTWLAIVSEWQRDWARTQCLDLVARAGRAFGGTGVALGWEFQLLSAPREGAACAPAPRRTTMATTPRMC